MNNIFLRYYLFLKRHAKSECIHFEEAMAPTAKSPNRLTIYTEFGHGPSHVVLGASTCPLYIILSELYWVHHLCHPRPVAINV
jgi:hypothetical protein